MAWARDTPWRQGHVIAHADAVALGLTAPNDDDAVAVLISHDCDIANDGLDEEPAVEVILARRMANANGNFTFAKHPRRLHLGFNFEGGDVCVELGAANRASVPKERLADYVPDARFMLPKAALAVLQSWLSSRYRRHALPDALVDRLRAVLPKFERSGRGEAHGIIGFWLDYQPDDNQLAAEEIYELWINVVFAVDKPEFASNAATVASALNEAFTAEYQREGKWTAIELRRCVAVAERDFTLRDMREMVEYKLEHISLRAEPQGPMNPA